MASNLLIVSIWLSGLCPQIAMQPMADASACERAMVQTAQMLHEQARRNLTAPHLALHPFNPAGSGENTLRTRMGREIARLRCVVTPHGDVQTSRGGT